MKKISFLFFLLSVFVQAQLPDIKPGELTDSVRVTTMENDTYAIYLPPEYSYGDTAKKWPVLYVFDPSGKGADAVRRFIPGAEAYGFIVIGSNDIRNGPYQVNFNKVRHIFDDTEQRFFIDPQKIYLAGFSGGARLATAIAVISDKVKGVIANSASFAGSTAYTPSTYKFIYVGLTGDEDFNYMEMHSSDVYLQKVGFNSTLLVFDGGHEWAPENYLTKALRTMVLRSLNMNILKPSNYDIAMLYQEDMHFDKDLENANRFLWTYDDLEQLLRDYDNLRDTDELKDRQKEIKRSKIYKAQRNSYRDLNERAYMEEYAAYLPLDIRSGDLEALGYWENELKTFESIYGVSKKTEEIKMYRRVTSYLRVVAEESSATLNLAEHADSILFTQIFYTLLDKKDYDAYKNILILAVYKGDYGMAWYYLEEMLKNGYRNSEELNSLKGIALLRIQPDYSEILAEYGMPSLYESTDEEPE
ncbi:alpha/beta hydrolase [Robertkochia solimangrovi]|uniref:alpha/beta hydrolase n=1 Tax=Robertkochia solimangrovi TaxID=2213046 RepID=UPI00117E6F8C|nr:alpha/beta hydrolase [Robertkochia solimangrovi]TRZ43736.1 alpha/beta hydrolase [Robertkochia solimangrovi]